MRKRSLLVLALVACMLSGCSMISKTKDIIDNKKDTETTAISDLADGDETVSDEYSDTTESETSETTEDAKPAFTVDEAILFDTDELKIKLNSDVDEDDEYYILSMDFENGQYTMGMYVTSCIVNNREMQPAYSYELSTELLDIKANSHGTGYLKIPKLYRDMPNLDVPETITLHFCISNRTVGKDYDNGDSVINIKTSNYTSDEFEYDDSGTEIYNKLGLRIVFRPYIDKVDQLYETDTNRKDIGVIYAENNGDHTFIIESYRVNVVGYGEYGEVESMFKYNVHPGCTLLNNLFIYLPGKSSRPDLSNIDKITFEISPKIKVNGIDGYDVTDTYTLELTK